MDAADLPEPRSRPGCWAYPDMSEALQFRSVVFDVRDWQRFFFLLERWETLFLDPIVMTKSEHIGGCWICTNFGCSSWPD